MAWLLLAGTLPTEGRAQGPQRHPLFDSQMPPGAIGRVQVIQRGGAFSGHYQAVEVRAPQGGAIALAADGRFVEPASPVRAAVLLGEVYRLRVSGIPQHEGEELYPTIEIIDRTYPPPGREAQFPIIVELSQRDMELALAGRYVTRVIYLEDPTSALANRNDPKAQEWFDVGKKDPLHVADALGRPVAILRIGSRVPLDAGHPELSFLYGCPPFQPLPVLEQQNGAARKGDRRASGSGRRPAVTSRGPWGAR
ncbi:MAG: hypothetical protein HYS13_26065 [Planctomycetia bacterium]|nr:hypothetical protein [Planctomycetia bacterium]